MWSPCCNLLPTTLAAKFIAILDLLFGIVGIIWFIYALDGYEYNHDNEMLDYEDSLPPPLEFQKVPLLFAWLSPGNETDSTLDTITKPSSPNKTKEQPIHQMEHSPEGIIFDREIANICISGLYTTVNLTLFLLLLNAISTKSVTKLKVCFYLRFAVCLLKCVIYTIYFLMAMPMLTQIPHAVFMVIHLYGLWVVSALIKEIKEERVTMEQCPATIFHTGISSERTPN